MPRGRRPAPAAVRAMKGNPGLRKIVAIDAPPPAGAIAAPSGISDAALAVWREISPLLQQLNSLRETDAPALERYCETIAAFVEITVQVDDAGPTHQTMGASGTMLRVTPEFAILDRLAARLVKMADRFGLDPEARQKVRQGLALSAGGGV